MCSTHWIWLWGCCTWHRRSRVHVVCIIPPDQPCVLASGPVWIVPQAISSCQSQCIWLIWQGTACSPWLVVAPCPIPYIQHEPQSITSACCTWCMGLGWVWALHTVQGVGTGCELNGPAHTLCLLDQPCAWMDQLTTHPAGPALGTSSGVAQSMPTPEPVLRAGSVQVLHTACALDQLLCWMHGQSGTHRPDHRAPWAGSSLWTVSGISDLDVLLENLVIQYVH